MILQAETIETAAEAEVSAKAALDAAVTEAEVMRLVLASLTSSIVIRRSMVQAYRARINDINATLAPVLAEREKCTWPQAVLVL